MKKILFINNIVTPTGTAFFNKLYLYLKGKGYLLKVLYLSESENNRSWNTEETKSNMLYEYRILSSEQLKAGKKDKFYFHINKNFLIILQEEKPDIIIHSGRASLSAWQSLKRCKKHHKIFILNNESTKFENSWRRTVTKPFVKYLVKHSDGYISSGSRAKEYLVILGANPNKICEYYDTVDVDYFTKKSEELSSQKQGLKSYYGIETKYVILFVGQLIERKGVYEILEGFKNFQNKNKDWSLVFVGGGKEKGKMEQIIREQNIKNVFFTGFLKKDKICEFYAIADIFTLPSREEVRGYVNNEAMCFGLPIITANEVGSSEDLVIEQKTGYVMKNHTAEEWCKGLNYIIENNLIDNNNSQQHIQKFKYDNFIPNIKTFLD